jgi:hypothetical protein
MRGFDGWQQGVRADGRDAVAVAVQQRVVGADGDADEGARRRSFEKRESASRESASPRRGGSSLAHGVVCQFVLACSVPTPHDPIVWGYHLGAWDGVGTGRTTQSGRYGPEELSRPAGATERRWEPFLPVPSRGTRRHRWVRVSNWHTARAIAGDSIEAPEALSRWGDKYPPLVHQYRELLPATDHQYQ